MSRLRFAVIGKPVAHSASPAVHNAAYAAMDLDARMIAVETDDARETILRLRDEGYSGLAVTIPHKEAALAVADGATPTARAAGAANTIVFAAGRIAAENTDVAGIARALASEGIS
ncbi:shikimate dehydrogenase, partial [bacterium]|nr:shikimate dehydrogenase [bacterium]